MEQKHLATWLKVMIVGVGICALLVYGELIPMCEKMVVQEYPEFSDRYLPWLFFIDSTGVLFYIGLGCCYKIAVNIGKDKSFSMENAKLLKYISNLAIGDVVYFFAGNFVMLALNFSHPGLLLASLIIDFIGVAIGVVAAALSHLVYKAAEMREENELTI